MIKTRLFSILQIMFVFLFTLAVTGYFSTLGVDPHHDGILLKPAIDMLHGKILFHDTFTQYGALTSIVQAVALHFFGEYLIVIKYLTVCFYGVIAIFLWLFWKKFLPSILTTLSIIIWVGLLGFYDKFTFLAWSSVYALLCQTVALYLFVLWIQHQRKWMIGAVGILSALAFWFRQPTGVYFFASVIFFWIITKIKSKKMPSLFLFYAGFFLIHIVFFLWLIKNNSFSDWWLMSISFANSWQSAVATQYRFPIFQISQLLPLSDSALSIWVLFPVVVLYQGYNLFRKKRLNIKELQLVATACICFFSWLQYYPMGDPTHTLWAATPMIGFYIYFAWNNIYKNKKRILVFLLLLLLLAPDIFIRMRNAKHKLLTPYYTFTEDTILKGMRETRENYVYFQTLIHAIHTYEKKHPNTFVVSLTQDALYPLLGKNDVNCSRFYVDWRWSIFDKQIEREYTSTIYPCLKKYAPLVITDIDHYNPPYYKKITNRPIPTLKNADIAHIDYLLAPAFPQIK